MGQFSWMDCKNPQRAILNGVKRNSYVLIPHEFWNTYGIRIEEKCYGGYGRFGGYDVYELVALWNREHICVENLRDEMPTRDQYQDGEDGDESYARGVRMYVMRRRRLEDFVKHVPDAVMLERYGQDWLREIGIDIACYDEQNAVLRYPIKITHSGKELYEACEPSLGDENQGWGYYVEMFDKDLQYMEYWEMKKAFYRDLDYRIFEYMLDNFEEETYQDYPEEVEAYGY